MPTNTENYKVQVSLFLPPSAQYAKGHMVNFRANDVGELADAIDGFFEDDGAFFAALVEQFRTSLGGVERPTQRSEVPEQPTRPSRPRLRTPSPAPRDGAINLTDDGPPCPQCGEGVLVERNGRFGTFTGCTAYPDCDYTEN